MKFWKIITIGKLQWYERNKKRGEKEEENVMYQKWGGEGLKKKARWGGQSRKGKNSEKRKDLKKIRRKSKHLTRNSNRRKKGKWKKKGKASELWMKIKKMKLKMNRKGKKAINMRKKENYGKTQGEIWTKRGREAKKRKKCKKARRRNKTNF